MVHGLVVVALLAVIIPFAIRAAQASPPPIAEFAPQVQKPITDAPQEQTARFGNGAGGQANGGGSASPTPSALIAALLPSPSPTFPPNTLFRRCVGNPPRQIEDSQSPPCVPFFNGPNGGATSIGVTKDTIKVATLCSKAPNKNGDDQDFATFFNRRFEFYGRQIVLDCHGWSATADAPTARADANAVVANGDFASTEYPNGDAGLYYYDELARNHVVAGATLNDFLTQNWMSQRPSVFQYEMSVDNVFSNLGQFTCDWLAGKPPSHMGGTALNKPTTRKFGIYFTYGATDSAVSTAPLKQALAQCGVAIDSNSEVDLLASDASAQAQQQAAVKLASAGVTTVFCLPSNVSAQCGPLQRDSTQQNFYPEWIFSTYGIADRQYDFKLFQFPAEQMANTFGITVTPRQINPQDEPWWWAMHEANPTQTNDGSTVTEYFEYLEYHSWLLLASGIQEAGPNLTPQTFAAGLQRALFPNPITPEMEGAVGFAGGSHSMTTDVAVWWWNNTARSPYTGDNPGTICYFNHGQRFNASSWARINGPDPLFNPTCDSGG